MPTNWAARSGNVSGASSVPTKSATTPLAPPKKVCRRIRRPCRPSAPSGCVAASNSGRSGCAGGYRQARRDHLDGSISRQALCAIATVSCACRAPTSLFRCGTATDCRCISRAPAASAKMRAAAGTSTSPSRQASRRKLAAKVPSASTSSRRWRSRSEQARRRARRRCVSRSPIDGKTICINSGPRS